MALDTMERTEEDRCSVVWLIGLSRSSLSRDAKLRAFRNLKRDDDRIKAHKVFVVFIPTVHIVFLQNNHLVSHDQLCAVAMQFR